MKNWISILIGKIIYNVLCLFKRKNNLAGKIALKLNKNILNYFKMPNTVICVTGSMEAFSTAKLIKDAYQDFGYTITFNKYAGQTKDIVTALLKNCTLKGKIKTDIAIFFVDVESVKQIFSKLKPNQIVITNITRDYTLKQKDLDVVFDKIKTALVRDSQLILNGDDPYLQKFNLNNEYKVTYYGINKLKYDYNNQPADNLNIYRCPNCLKPLNYDFYHIEHLGNYYCSNCTFKTPDEEYKITTCDFENNKIKINNTWEINIVNNTMANLYNIISAFTILSLNKLNNKEICKSITKIESKNQTLKMLKYKSRKVYILKNRIKNTFTFNQSLSLINRDENLKTIVIGWREKSDYNDISWLYDVNFETLNNNKIDKIICLGPQKYDLATRIKYAGIEEKKIKVFYNLYDAKDTIKKSKGNIYAMLHLDYIKSFNKFMEEEK